MNKKMMIALVVIAVLGIGGMFAYPMAKQAALESNPVNHILYSGVQTESATDVDATATFTFALDEEKMVEIGAFSESEDPKASVQFVNTLLERVELEYDIVSKMDYEANDLQMAMDMGLTYKDIPVIEFGANVQPWEGTITAPQMINGDMYVNIQDIIDLSGEDIQLSDVDIAAYLKVLYEKDDKYNAVVANASAYETIFRNLLEGKVEKLGKGKVAIELNGQASEVPVVQYKLLMTMDDIYNMYAELINVAKTDENVKAFVIDRVEKIEQLVIANEDYAMFGLAKEDVLAEFELAKTEINDNWESALEELATEMMTQREQLKEYDVNQEMTNIVLSIDKKNIMRQVSLDIITEGLILNETITYNAIGDGVVLPEIAKGENTRDLIEVVNDPIKISTLQEEVITNLQSKLLGGEAVTTLLSDIKTDVEVLPEGERDAMIQNFEETVNGMKMMLPFMMSGMGL